MKSALLITCLLIISLAAFENTGFAQKKSCTCKEVVGRTCSATVTCTNGCSAICGRKDTCYVSCSARVYPQKLNLDFVQKTADEMVATLVAESRLRLKFKANPRNENEKYDYKLINSDVWKLFEFLDERGTLVVNGIDFDRLRDLKKHLSEGEKLPRITFSNVPVEEAVGQLEIMTGENLRILSGNPRKRISVSVSNVSLVEVLEAIRRKYRVRVAVGT